MPDLPRVALLLDPLSLSLDARGLHVKWASHAPELARELLGRGYHVRGFGAPPGVIPRSSSDDDGGDYGPLHVGKLRAFAPDVIVAYEALSPAALRGARMARSLGATLVLVEGAWRGGFPLKDRVLRRVLPQSLLGRLTLVMVIGVLLTQLVGNIIWAAQRRAEALSETTTASQHLAHSAASSRVVCRPPACTASFIALAMRPANFSSP